MLVVDSQGWFACLVDDISVKQTKKSKKIFNDQSESTCNLLDSLYHILANAAQTSSWHPSGQIIIFHQPRFPANKGISLTKPPVGGPGRVRSL